MAQPQEVVTLSLMDFSQLRTQWWAFQQMGLSPWLFRRVAGAKMIKMLGSGGGNGFSIRPNFGRYALLCVWESEAAAQVFFRENKWWQQAARRSSNCYTLYMHTAAVHGLWGGICPFDTVVPLDKQRPLAVITRATIRWRHLPGFWRFVPSVSAQAKGHAGQQLSIGIGEWPLFMQATFSLWQDTASMMEYAYTHARHREVVQKTRELGWYKEELFARFHPYREEGVRPSQE
ncbi:MAG: hypothetical protein R2795_14630 [Saprospiraceae bacterium]